MTSICVADLRWYIEAWKLPDSPQDPAARSLLQAVAAVDFSSARAALVGSVPGRHQGSALHKWVWLLRLGGGEPG